MCQAALELKVCYRWPFTWPWKARRDVQAEEGEEAVVADNDDAGPGAAAVPGIPGITLLTQALHVRPGRGGWACLDGTSSHGHRGMPEGHAWRGGMKAGAAAAPTPGASCNEPAALPKPTQDDFRIRFEVFAGAQADDDDAANGLFHPDIRHVH